MSRLALPNLLSRHVQAWPKRRLTAAERELIRSMRLKRIHVVEIAEQLRCSISAVTDNSRGIFARAPRPKLPIHIGRLLTAREARVPFSALRDRFCASETCLRQRIREQGEPLP